ncbi:hypothetical protein NGM33_24555 [Nocardiopsis dassonvillei]|jgi:hypothetical protein|uniref:hypothetical protein n=1 Tax=Nocardiopsis dassonvillei TaxID=2014 RepID=UPI00102AB904|nr:hypothetical protein [Nocardiopsis dassonvillei]MCP3016504.1 hypothetical protein [Nocardiopsis dassonvillei]
MASVSSLVNIAVFGVVGAILMAALLGLLLVVSGSSRGASPRSRAAFGIASVVVLVALPTLAAANALAAGSGFWAGFAASACVAAVVSAVNVVMLPMVARRQSSGGGQSAVSALRPSLPLVAAALLVCLALGLVGASVAALVV